NSFSPRNAVGALVAMGVFLVLGLSRPALAADDDTALYAEGGLLGSNLFSKTTSSDDASGSLIGTKQITVGVAARIGFFRPAIDYTVFGHSPKDESYKSRTLIVSVPYLFNPGESIELKAGPSVWMTTISGDGGDIELANGTSTATFSKPGRSETTRNLALMVGAYLAASEKLGEIGRASWRR